MPSPARTFVLIFIVVVSLSGVVGLLFAADAAITGLHVRLDLHTRASQSSLAPARTLVLIFMVVSSC
jgi:hypothetical protein